MHNIRFEKIIFRGLNLFVSCFNDNQKEYIIEVPNFITLHENLNYLSDNVPFKKYWYSNKYFNFDLKEFEKPKLIDSKNFDSRKKTIIINTLDEYYGHSLFKIIDSIDLLKESFNFNLIIICQKKFKWMFEKASISKYIIFSNKLDISKYIIELDAILNDLTLKYEDIYFKISKPHPFKNFDSNYLIGVSSFNFKNFQKKPYNVTYIYRSDRLWHSNLFERKVFHFSKKFKIKFIISLITLLNNYKIKKLYQSINKYFGSDFKLTIIGDGNKFFHKEIIDKRNNDFSYEYDKDCFNILSKSHISIGIQGSNMILPSFLSAGFIEIIPDYDEQNYLNDIILNKSNNYNALYFSRFVYEFPNHKYLSKLVFNMLNNYKLYKEIDIIK